MNTIKQHLKKCFSSTQNGGFNHKKIWLDSMSGMSLGFFSTLIVGSLFGLIGLYSIDNIFIETKKVISFVVPFAIGVGVGIKAKFNPVQIVCAGMVCMIAGHSGFIVTFTKGSGWNFTSASPKILLEHATQGNPGDVIAAWISSAAVIYLFEIFNKRTNFDFIILPLAAIIVGITFALSLSYLISIVSVFFQWIIYLSVGSSYGAAVGLAPIVGLIVGLALTLPISSAALVMAIRLDGDAASAAMVGCAAQMASFGVLTWWSTKSVPRTIAVAFGTSMLHIENYARKPIILLIPCLCSTIAAIVAVASLGSYTNHGDLLLPFSNNEPIPRPTSGMGLAVLYGPIFTLDDNHSWGSWAGWVHVLCFQLALPILLTIALIWPFAKKGWIKKEWFQIW